MSRVGLRILLRDAHSGELVTGIIRDESPLSFFVELTGGRNDGAVVALEKAKCRNLDTLPEGPAALPDEPDPGEEWKGS